MLFYFGYVYVGVFMIMQCAIDTSYVFHVLNDFGDVVTYHNDSAIVIDAVQHLVHLFFETFVDVGIGLV